jgi:hypothetical protein
MEQQLGAGGSMSVILATWEAEIRRMKVSPGKQFARPHFQNNQSKMDWRYGSGSFGVPALQG